MTKKKKTNSELQEDACHLYYNKGLRIQQIAELTDKSERTIYRWLNQKKNAEVIDPHFTKPKQTRQKRYKPEVFSRIKQLKEELPVRTAVTIKRLLQEELNQDVPSVSAIRKFLAAEGYAGKDIKNRAGYIVFERKQPNDLWQIDIAGVQTVGHLGQLYLFALIDDCSRYIPAVFYAPNEKAMHVIELLKQAITRYGRPNQILADNGTQFKNILGELGTKYARLLTTVFIRGTSLCKSTSGNGPC
jgi:transposase